MMEEPPTFVIISGLPGTGKSTLAEGMTRDLGWRVVAIDDVAEIIDRLTGEDPVSFWDRAIVELLRRAREALEGLDEGAVRDEAERILGEWV